MINILRVEFFRLKKSKLFWILLGVTAALPILSAILLTVFFSILESIFEGGGEMISALEMLRASGTTGSILSELASIAGDAALFSLITVGVVLSKEFTDGTMRNVILANKKRKELYFAYFIVAVVVGLTYMLAYMLTALIIVAPIFGFGDLTAGQIASAIFCSLALGVCSVLFVQSCVCMFLFAVRKQWATILFPILIIVFAPSIFNTLVTLLTLGLAFQGQTLSPVAISWIPFANAAQFNASAIDGGLVGKIALYYLLFAAVFTVSGYFTFEKADLK